MIIKVRSLDVWGNATDGFEVNDSYTAGEIEVSDVVDDYEDSRIIGALIDAGYLKECARNRARIDGYVTQERAEVQDARTGEPLYWLDCEEQES